MTTAGHTFDSLGFCRCGKKWMNIMHCDRSYVGEFGYDHVGGRLTENEVDQIMKLKAAQDALHDRMNSGRREAPQAEVAAVDDVELVSC